MANAKKPQETAKNAPKKAAKSKAANDTAKAAKAKTGANAPRSESGTEKPARNQSTIDTSVTKRGKKAPENAKPEKTAKNAPKTAEKSKAAKDAKKSVGAKTGAKAALSEGGAAKGASTTTKKPSASNKKTPRNQSAIDTAENLNKASGGYLPELGFSAAGFADFEGVDEASAGDREAQVIYSLNPAAKIYVKTAVIVNATGRTKSWVRQLTARGVFVEQQTAHGPLFELISTIQAYIEYLDSGGDDDEGKAAEIQKKIEDARLKRFKADVAEMQAKELQGKLHRSEDVQKMTGDLLYYVRGSLNALAGRCATDCAASSNPAEIQKIIEREVFAILKELSEYKYDPERYDELVRQRTRREVDDVADDDENE